jgi:hypothetical protein
MKEELKAILKEMFEKGEIAIEIVSDYDYGDNSVDTHVYVNIDGEQVAHSSSYAYLPSND